MLPLTSLGINYTRRALAMISGVSPTSDFGFLDTSFTTLLRDPSLTQCEMLRRFCASICGEKKRETRS
ncbi:hypothetical protein CapIbe_022025 [Capra ibex]